MTLMTTSSPPLLGTNPRFPKSMNLRFKTSPALSRTAALASFLLTPYQTARGKPMENPDRTQGGTIPEGTTHDWNIGAIGARSWMHSLKFTTVEARTMKRIPSSGSIRSRAPSTPWRCSPAATVNTCHSSKRRRGGRRNTRRMSMSPGGMSAVLFSLVPGRHQTTPEDHPQS